MALSVRDQLRAFGHERDWSQFRTPENLAKSIVIESAERGAFSRPIRARRVMDHIRGPRVLSSLRSKRVSPAKTIAMTRGRAALSD